MKYTHNNKGGFSIVIAMAIIIFIGLAAVYILEYIIPFGRNVKGVENASKSYYKSNSALEQSLWFIGQNPVGAESSDVNSDYEFTITAMGNQLPMVGRGNSDYDTYFNTLSEGNPIQLEIGDNRVSDWDNVEFNIQVPDTTEAGAYDIAGGTDFIINWQLSSTGTTMNSYNSGITADDINTSAPIILGSKIGQWIDRDTGILESDDFEFFYNSECRSGKSCILKMTIVQELISTTSSTLIPYLEYQIDLPTGETIPLRFVQIQSSGKSNGFKKDLNVRVPQLTVDGAFDFTVLQ